MDGSSHVSLDVFVSVLVDGFCARDLVVVLIAGFVDSCESAINDICIYK